MSEAMTGSRNAAKPRPAKNAPNPTVLGRVFTKDPARPEVAAANAWQDSETDKLLRETADLLARLREAVEDASTEAE